MKVPFDVLPWVQYLPSWIDLRRLGGNGLVRSSAVWAMVVPIAARLLQDVQDPINVFFLSQNFKLHLTLPFSWKVLFIVSVLFMVATVIYELACPALIKETKNYRAFSDQGRGGFELLQELERLKDLMPLPEAELGSYMHWLMLHRSVVSGAQHQGDIAVIRDADLMLSNVYRFITHNAALTKPWARGAAAVLYSAGFLGIAYLVYENITFVMRHW